MKGSRSKLCVAQNNLHVMSKVLEDRILEHSFQIVRKNRIIKLLASQLPPGRDWIKEAETQIDKELQL